MFGRRGIVDQDHQLQKLWYQKNQVPSCDRARMWNKDMYSRPEGLIDHENVNMVTGSLHLLHLTAMVQTGAD